MVVIDKNSRNLSKKEIERKEKFDMYTVEMEKQGFSKKDLTISIMKANVLGIILSLPIILIIAFIYYKANDSSIFDLNRSNIFEYDALLNIWISIFPLYLLLIVIHELIHGVTWAMFAKNGFNSISFGVIWKYVTPYCTCNSSMKKKEYIIGAIMPTLILGVIPSIISIFIGNEVLFYIGQLMILSGGGDMCMIIELLNYKSNAEKKEYMDHPYEVGLVVFEK